MSDDLDKKTDQELDAIFAVEVAGWNRKEHDLFWDPINNRSHIFRGSVLHQKRLELGLPTEKPFLAGFCNDANAVLPYLSRHHYDAWNNAGGGVKIRLHLDGRTEGVSYEPFISFTRAAVIALIRAKRSSS